MSMSLRSLFLAPRRLGNMTNKLLKNNKGYTVLLAVLVIGVVCVSVSLYIFSSVLNSSGNSFILEQSNKAKALANACAEIAISRIQTCSTTLGNFNLQLGEEQCDYEILSASEQEKVVNSSARVGDVVRKARINLIQDGSAIAVSSWQEVASF